MRIRVVAPSLCLALLAAPAASAGPQEDLLAACKTGDLAGATKALDGGANVNAVDADGGTAIAAAFLWPEVTKLLLSRKADPNLGSSSAVVGAASYYSIDTLRLLLDAGADPNKPVYASSVAGIRKMIAAERAKGNAANQANIKAWEGLLENPAVKNAKPVEYYALRTAIYGSSCVPCVALLLAKGAKLDKGITDGSMLHVFADSISPTPEEWKKSYAESKATLVGLGLTLPDWYAEVLSPDRIGTAAEMLKLLLDKGLAINQKGKSTGGEANLTPLEITLNHGAGKKPHVMLALIAAGADVKHGTVLLQAAETGFVDVVKAMVEKGADLNVRGEVLWNTSADTRGASNFTPLTAAALKNNTEVVKYLVGAGAKRSGVSGRQIMKVRDAGGGTADTITCLFDVKDKSAIYFAIENKNLELVKFLAENNAFDGRPYTLTAVHVGTAGCWGGGTFGASAYAQHTNASPETVAYLKAKGL